MTEYIERDNAIDELTAENLVDRMDSVFDSIPNRFHRAAQRVIAGIPAADVRPVVRGEWEPDIEDVKWGSSLIKMRCSNCKSYAHFDKEAHRFILSDFCPNCGAALRTGSYGKNRRITDEIV